MVDFRHSVPDLTSFPRRDWAWALREGCRRATVAELDYGDPRGTVALREVLAGYLRRVRGAMADPEQIVVCAGFGQGVNLVLQTLAGDGVRRVAIEDPGDDDYRAIAARIGIEAVAVPIDESGIDVPALAVTGTRALILTPTHQFPTGAALAPEWRQALVAWATSTTQRSSRMTTTPSSDTTANTWARSRDLRPTESPCWARSAGRSPGRSSSVG
jgi:GntR family transcriptional regulator / MocR family aminotransferase